MHRLKALRPLEQYFKEPQRPSAFSHTGLFGNPNLTSPQSLTHFAESSLQRAHALSTEIECQQVPDNECVLHFDVLSDIICKVVDMVAFVRMTHPNTAMLNAAQAAHENMFEFMNHLNTNVGLYRQLRRVLDKKGPCRANFTNEELTVGEILMYDFERSGIQFPKETRKKFVESSNVVSIEGQEFLNEIGPAKQWITFDSAAELGGLDPAIIKSLKTLTGRVRVPLDNQLSEMALQTVQNRSSRERIWRAIRTASPTQIERLEKVLHHRAIVAKLSGYDSFASYELSNKLLDTPQQVHSFLCSLKESVKPRALAEIESLFKNKAMMPWDLAYLNHKRSVRNRGLASLEPSPAALLSEYLGLGSVVQGLSDLFETLYGLRFEGGTILNGEVWHKDVRRLDVYEGCQRIGVIYCDLYARDGKSPNPAHFTIQCARKIWDFENSTETTQIPIIALLCNFPVNGDTDALLSLEEVETLFHEFGHAIHSMIGRTSLHNVSGTRCATDFVELPSVIMECFAQHSKVLSTFAKHHLTGEAPPQLLLEHSLNREKPLKNVENYHQIIWSFMDQALHSKEMASGSSNAFELVSKVRESHSLFPSVQTLEHAQFGHFVSYGATYYSYLLDRCLASEVWQSLFKQDPLSPESGRRFKNMVLQWGGARDARTCVEDVLGKPMDTAELARCI